MSKPIFWSKINKKNYKMLFSEIFTFTLHAKHKVNVISLMLNLLCWKESDYRFLVFTSETFLTIGFSTKEDGSGYISCSALPYRIIYFSIIPELPRSLGGCQHMCKSTANGSSVGVMANETFSALPGGSTANKRVSSNNTKGS